MDSVSVSELSSILNISVQGTHKLLKEHNINTLVSPRKHRVTPSQAQKAFKIKGIYLEKQVLNIHNMKGGIGKTTISHAISRRAAALGFKTLVIDLDPQANLSRSFGHRKRRNVQPTFQSICFNEFNGGPISIKNAVITLNDFLDLLPADMAMSNFDIRLTLASTGNGVQDFFNPIFSKLRSIYDIIVLDSPPAINSITLGATYNSDKLIIPTDADDFTVDGIHEVFEQLKQALKKNIAVRPIICLNRIDQSRGEELRVVAEIYETFGEYVAESSLPTTKLFKENISLYKNIWEYSAKYRPKILMYLDNFIHEILGFKSSNSKEVKTFKGDIHV